MFRFTIRDLLWVALVVAFCFGWFVHIQVKDRQRDARYEETIRHNAQVLDWYRGSYDLVVERFDKVEPDWRDRGNIKGQKPERSATLNQE